MHQVRKIQQLEPAALASVEFEGSTRILRAFARWYIRGEALWRTGCRQGSCRNALQGVREESVLIVNEEEEVEA